MTLTNLLCCFGRRSSQMPVCIATDNDATQYAKLNLGLSQPHITMTEKDNEPEPTKLGVEEKLNPYPEINTTGLNTISNITNEFTDKAITCGILEDTEHKNLWERARDPLTPVVNTYDALSDETKQNLPYIRSCSHLIARYCVNNGWRVPVCVIGGSNSQQQLLLDVCPNPQYNKTTVLKCNGTIAYIMENHEHVEHLLTNTDPAKLPIYGRFVPKYLQELWTKYESQARAAVRL